MHLQTYVFITCDFLSIIKYGGEGQKTSTYAFITLLLPVNGENFYIYQAKVNQIVATKLASRKFNTNQWVHFISVRRAMLPFFWFSCIMPDVVRESAVLGSKICPVCCVIIINTLSTCLDRKLSLCGVMDWIFGQTLHGWLEGTLSMRWFAVFA